MTLRGARAEGTTTVTSALHSVLLSAPGARGILRPRRRHRIMTTRKGQLMPLTVITIGGSGKFAFSAAHAGLHDGEFEPLHGHSFTVTLRLHGEQDDAGMVCDFTAAKNALAAVIAPLRRRTLMPARLAGGRCEQDGGQVVIEYGDKLYSLPAGDVMLLPVTNTTTEQIAGWLLGELVPALTAPGLRLAELVLAEAPDTAATVTARLWDKP
jgi:6-pyruvoyl-tetrahydropterin synthase